MKSWIVLFHKNRKNCLAFYPSGDDCLCHWTLQSSIPTSHLLTSAPRIMKMVRCSHRFLPSGKLRKTKTKSAQSSSWTRHAQLVMVAKENVGSVGEEVTIAEGIEPVVQIKSRLYQAVNGIYDFPFNHTRKSPLRFTKTRIGFCIRLWFKMVLVGSISVQSLNCLVTFNRFCFSLNLQLNLWIHLDPNSFPNNLANFINSPDLKIVILTCL